MYRYTGIRFMFVIRRRALIPVGSLPRLCSSPLLGSPFVLADLTSVVACLLSDSSCLRHKMFRRQRSSRKAAEPTRNNSSEHVHRSQRTLSADEARRASHDSLLFYQSGAARKASAARKGSAQRKASTASTRTKERHSASSSTASAPPPPRTAQTPIYTGPPDIPARITLEDGERVRQQMRSFVEGDLEVFMPENMVSYATGPRPGVDAPGTGPGMYYALG